MRSVIRRLSPDWRDSYDAARGARRLEHRALGLSVEYAEDLHLDRATAEAVWEALCTAAYDGATGQHRIEISRNGSAVDVACVPVISSPFAACAELSEADPLALHRWGT